MKEKQTTIEAAYAKGFEDYAKGLEGAVEFNKSGLDAIVSAAAIAAKGYGELSASWLDFARNQIEEGAASATKLLSCKSPQEAVDVQNNFASKSFDRYVAAGAKLTEISHRTANEMLSPVGAHMNAALDKFWKPRPAA